jgi:hypothetical protein
VKRFAAEGAPIQSPLATPCHPQRGLLDCGGAVPRLGGREPHVRAVGGRKQEKSLRQTLSAAQFETELPKVVSAFKVAPPRRAGKSVNYALVEGVARFILSEAVARARRAGKMASRDDLSAAAALSAIVCDNLCANGGLSDAEARELQGFVPAFVFPTVAGDLLKNASDFRSIVAKGLLRYDVMSQDDKRARVLKRVDAAVTQFVCQRKVEYLDALAQAMAELR